MKRIRNIMVLAPFVFLAATCVTDVRQKGEAGPWVGEVVNHSETAVAPVSLNIQFFDSAGRFVGTAGAGVTRTCPSQLEPGQTGTFEAFAPRAIRGPLTMRVANISAKPVAEDISLHQDGLRTRLVQIDVSRNYALVELHNASNHTYTDTVVCGNLRTDDGQLQEVGATTPFPDTIEPGDVRVFPVFFNTMPESNFEFFPLGKQDQCCPDAIIPSDAFKEQSSKVIDYAGQSFLIALGEVSNQTDRSLSGLQIAAHASTSWADRIRLRDQSSFGCGGIVPRRTSVPMLLRIPLDSREADPVEEIEGIAATVSDEAPFSLEVESVSAGPPTDTLDGQLGERLVTATVRNQTGEWAQIVGSCVMLRDDEGRLVGMRDITRSGWGIGYPTYLAPGASATTSQAVIQLGASSSAEVVVFAAARPGPPPPFRPVD